jgi:uncharacterized protein YkwD
MQNKPILVLIFVATFVVTFIDTFSTKSMAQSRWQQKDYKAVTHLNFRNNPIFQQKLDKNLDYGLLNATLFYVVNEYRVKNRKTALNYHTNLEIVAWNHARQMGQFMFFGHDNPKDAKRSKLENRGDLAGISNPFLTENLAYVVNEKADTYLAICEKFLLQWKSKKENLALLLSDDALQAACGVFFFQNKWYAVQVFQSFEEIVSKSATDKLPE